MSSVPQHVAVLLAEIIEWLAPQPGQTFADGTLGAGGHTRAIAEKIGPTGLVIACDRDPAAIEAAELNLAGLSIRYAQTNFCDLPEVFQQLDLAKMAGIVLDLGLSSDQLSDENRGFSFTVGGPLDLRFNPHEGEPAWRLLERLSEPHLADVIFQYGEERFSRRIAKKIVERRHKEPIRTADDLANLVRSCIPFNPKNRIDPATRTFQALRIAVNDELKSLETALRRLPDCLQPGGRLAIISFHSLEDRRVKEAFRDDPRLEVLTRKPITASDAELQRNPRSRSAKLRVAQRK